MLYQFVITWRIQRRSEFDAYARDADEPEASIPYINLPRILLVHVREGLGGGAVGLHLPPLHSKHCPVPVSEDGDGLTTKLEAITNLLVVSLHGFRYLFAWSLTQHQSLAGPRSQGVIHSLACAFFPCPTAHETVSI